MNTDLTGSPGPAVGATGTSQSANGLQPKLPPAVTYRQMMTELNREISLRVKLYPGWISGGRMTQATADRQLNALIAIADVIRPLMEAEQLVVAEQKAAEEPSLF